MVLEILSYTDNALFNANLKNENYYFENDLHWVRAIYCGDSGQHSHHILPRDFTGAPQVLSHWYNEIWVTETDEILCEKSSVSYT